MADDNAAQSEWQALMGQDLLLKIVHRTTNPSSSEDSAANGGVQPQDAVVVDFVGRCLLETPSNSSTGEDEASEAMEGEEADPESSGLNESMKEGDIFHEAKGWLLVVGEKDVVPALEMGIRFMRVGETALVRSHSKYAYGPGQRNWKSKGIDRAYTLPANSTVQYTVTLQRIVPALEVETRRFQLQLCDSKKLIGNDIYNNDHLASDNLYAKSRALQVYQRAADILIHLLQQQATEGEGDTGDDDILDTTAARDCLLACLNNIAAVHLKCQSYHAAKEACVTVLERDPSNVKALMRAAQAALLDPASSYEEVDAAIQAASSATKKAASEQHSSTVATGESFGKLGGELERLRRDLQRKQRAHAKKERAMWFAKMARSTLESADEKVNRISALPLPPTLAGDQLDEVDRDLLAPDQDMAAIPNGNGPSSDQDDPVPNDDTNLDVTSGSFWQSLPWKRVILPYGLQLIAPFVMYYFFLQMRQQSINRESGHGNSSGNSGDMRTEL